MSYCRIGKNSDVYVYVSMSDWYWHCGCCRLAKKVETVFSGKMYGDTRCKTPEEMYAHLLKHKSVRHKVPRGTFTRLKKDFTIKKKG